MARLVEELKVITRNAVKVIAEGDLEQKLSKGNQLRVKLGLDPTAPDIHLGHSVVLKKLRQFQDLGHKAVLIFGDFTAMIGDVSGHSKARVPLTKEKVLENAKTYLDQVSKIIDVNSAEIHFNSEWLGKLDFYAITKIASKFTVAQMIDRDEFKNRFEKGVPIGLHEFLYVLMQAYDSVVVKADVELGGTEQLFNLMAGRDLMRAFDMEPQITLTLPILVGTDGKIRMSKSLGNYIGITDEPFEMYSKLMSIPDELLENYFKLLTELNFDSSANPMENKKLLGKTIVSMYHGAAIAAESTSKWDKVFSKREIPEEIENLKISKNDIQNSKIWLVRLVASTGIPSSNSDARRLIEQGGVELNNQKLTDTSSSIEIKEGDILRVGKKKRYFKLHLDT